VDEKWIACTVKRAKLLHWQRFSCSEAVWLALNQELDEEFLRFGSKMAAGFAGGVASGSLCGAIAGGVLSISARFSHYPEELRSILLRDLEEKYYQMMKESLGSVYCRDLKPTDSTQRRVCNQIIAKACETAAKMIVEYQGQIHSDKHQYTIK
jgi:C_GCAxxG_C_C family probable redox protein